ncbi:MAG TPA: glutathionylspermidine synthase family protein [Casimicrobiaceae bacterium]|nr:glutathionylspermidine synthase family protein [Casimicrobiaceae bacterium]
MIREDVTPRPNWRADCEEIGFTYHSMDGTYWDETRCYRFTADEIDTLEAAAAELHARCLDAVEHIVTRNRFAQLAIPIAWRDRVARAWRAKELSLFGRFDFSFDGNGAPKLLEYNADTPTALLEASVAQWRWLEQKIRPDRPDADQFNSLHEKLIASWRAFAVTWSEGTAVHFTCVGDSEEDRGNLDYLRDVATQGGVTTRYIAVNEIGWDATAGVFVDDDEEEIRVLCKLYPWEWLAAETFGPYLLGSSLRVIEPPWKMLLSNKGILPILWELFPDHPNLLPAYFEPGRIAGDYVRKPLLSREGANVTIHQAGNTIAAGGEYGEEGYVYQAYAPIPRFGDDYTTIGAWIVGDEPAGIGLREDASPITRNTSRFVPHYFL